MIKPINLSLSDTNRHTPKIIVNYTMKLCLKSEISILVISNHNMLDICFDQGSKLDIQFNPSKSCLFKSGPGYNQLLPNLHIGNEPILGW